MLVPPAEPFDYRCYYLILKNLLYQSMVVLISAVQPSSSCIHVFFFIFFPHRLLQDIEYSFQCYTVGPCFLHILLYRCYFN